MISCYLYCLDNSDEFLIGCNHHNKNQYLERKRVWFLAIYLKSANFSLYFTGDNNQNLLCTSSMILQNILIYIATYEAPVCFFSAPNYKPVF